jgi:hypothetical protein
MERFIYSKKAFVGLFKTVQVSRVIILERCSLREVLLYKEIRKIILDEGSGNENELNSNSPQGK